MIDAMAMFQECEGRLCAWRQGLDTCNGPESRHDFEKFVATGA
jgi:hypothetical protein